jgi:hypothetical protein
MSKNPSCLRLCVKNWNEYWENRMSESNWDHVRLGGLCSTVCTGEKHGLQHLLGSGRQRTPRRASPLA